MQIRHSVYGVMLIACIVLSACGGPGQDEIPPLTASMSELEGTVLIRKSGEENMQFASDQTLEQSDQVVTGDDGRVRLDLSTGSIVRIAPSSMFTLVTSGEGSEGVKSTMQLDAGSLWLILNGGSAEVETPSGVASVRGSYLMVSVLPGGGVYLTCLEGDCRIRNQSGEYFLTTGQSATVVNAMLPPTIQQMTPEEVEEWLAINPEAILVIPSLTATLQVTETAEPTGTSAPSETPVPSPSNTPVPSPTPFPTAVPSNTPKPKPPAENNDPPPAPSPTNTPVPPPGWGYSVSNVIINGGNTTVNINASFPVSFDFAVWNDASCPSCIDQLVVGLDSTSTYCAYDGIPAVYPGTNGSNGGNLTAPSSPGTYDVVVHQDLQFTCIDAINANAGFGSQVIGTINVVVP